MYIKNKILRTIMIFVVIFIFIGCNNNSGKRQLVGVWELFDIDESNLPGSASSPIMTTVLELYRASIDRSDMIRAMGSGNILLAGQIGRNIDSASEALKTVKLIFDRNEMILEVMGQKEIVAYTVRDEAIRIDRGGILTESGFRIEDDFLFFGGFSWIKENFVLNGAWGNDEREFNLSDGKINIYLNGNQILHGIYSTSGNSITTTITHIRNTILKENNLEFGMYSREKLSELGFNNLKLDRIFITVKGEFSINPSTISFDRELYDLINEAKTGL